MFHRLYQYCWFKLNFLQARYKPIIQKKRHIFWNWKMKKECLFVISQSDYYHLQLLIAGRKEQFLSWTKYIDHDKIEVKHNWDSCKSSIFYKIRTRCEFSHFLYDEIRVKNIQLKIKLFILAHNTKDIRIKKN